MALRNVLWVLCVAVVGVSPWAHADLGQDVAAAETLFREAKDLMREGRYPQACPKLEASQRLDPSTGTLLNLADCHEKTGRMASAWAEYSTVVTLARRAGQPERENVAREGVERLEPRLVRLTVLVPPESAVEGLEVERDGSLIVPAMFGAALPIDPGRHLVRAKAKGKRPWEKEFEVVGEGTTITVSVPMLEDLPAPLAPTAPAATRTQAPSEPRPVSVEPSDPSHRRMWGFLVGGTGLAGLAAGSALAVSARSQWTDSGCSSGQCPDDSSQQLADSARSRADYATVGFVAGAVLLGAGAVLVLTAPSPDSERKAAAPTIALALGASRGQAAVAMHGRF